MIGRLVGTLIEKTPQGRILLDVNGLGYNVDMPLSSLVALPKLGLIATILIHQIIREDAQLLFGFISSSERDLFRLLIKVSGVGPKIAIVILSGLTPDEFSQVIINADIVRLSKVPGIGKKTAERLILELKDKVSTIIGDASVTSLGEMRLNDPIADAVAALSSLGYKPSDAEKMIKKIALPDMNVDDLIKRALQNALK